jgi:transcriptional regulator with GAF, ATPase, and Fis domain
MAALRSVVERVATVDSTVLVRGETGTGKELVARLIHAGGPRADGPFVVVNCTAIPGELLESELFGHERGAFTGAAAARAGRVEQADGGTLLLDEIGDMPTTLQPKLLRFLQDRRVQRVGGSHERAVDVRVIAATHRDLEQAMAAGDFRPDLFHRLDTIPITVPPLRDRPSDLPELCDHLLAKIASRLGRPVPRLDPAGLDALAANPFPGNVRELENLLERSMVLSDPRGDGRLRLEGSPPRAVDHPGPHVAELPIEGGFARLQQLHREAERELVARALRAWPGCSNGEIAERLGTQRRVLERRLKDFGLSKR